MRNPLQTSTTYHAGDVYGSDGHAVYSGTSTTTSSGGVTTYNIPYSRKRYDFIASYWVKLKPPVFGAFFTDLTPELRHQLERNRGAVINIVLKDSPAFNADFLPGDVIIAVDDIEIRDGRALMDVISSSAGETVAMRFIRRTKEKSVSVQLREKT